MTIQYARRVLITDDPIPKGRIAQAPRPLHGTPVDTGLMGFSVNVDDLDDELHARNVALDAHEVIYVTRDDALDFVKARVRSDYGDAAGVDLDDDEWLSMFRPDDYLAALDKA